MQPYIVFALARTGSTTLFNQLNCREGLRCFFEPFNPTNVHPFLAQCLKLREQHGLMPVVQALWRAGNGFKHVWDWGGFPFADNPDLNRQLLVESGAKIILMHRRNLLQRAISVQISAQMNLWTPYLAEHFEVIRNHRFGPLDIAKLKKEVEDAGQAIPWAREQLGSHKISFMEITYEELFGENLTMEMRMKSLQSIFEFIGVGAETAPERLGKMCELFNPATTGFQNVQAYTRIPNIHEVDAVLSSAEAGNVFEKPGSAGM